MDLMVMAVGTVIWQSGEGGHVQRVAVRGEGAKCI